MPEIITIEEIQKILPQKPPFLMIDRIVEFKKGESLTAIKNITGNEWNFQGDKYNTGKFPETLLMEAAAQAALVFYYLNQENKSGKIVLGQIKADFNGYASIGEVLSIVTGDYKILDNQGFISVDINNKVQRILNAKIFYGVLRNG